MSTVIIDKVSLPEENTKTKTHRGRPHMYIVLLADGRPRITGLKDYLTNIKSKVMTNCIHVN